MALIESIMDWMDRGTGHSQVSETDEGNGVDNSVEAAFKVGGGNGSSFVFLTCSKSLSRTEHRTSSMGRCLQRPPPSSGGMVLASSVNHMTSLHSFL